ncbi:hypothetical protein [Chromobacterium subtsugae]|uniref:hypothetical protein n=2 Tax=Chromobacterium subtsugae TaxID=251747 RepID=UPI00128D7F6D|nr:hypothetical protein [Chromobacterium subtsugae]
MQARQAASPIRAGDVYFFRNIEYGVVLSVGAPIKNPCLAIEWKFKISHASGIAQTEWAGSAGRCAGRRKGGIRRLGARADTVEVLALLASLPPCGVEMKPCRGRCARSEGNYLMFRNNEITTRHRRSEAWVRRRRRGGIGKGAIWPMAMGIRILALQDAAEEISSAESGKAAWRSKIDYCRRCSR